MTANFGELFDLLARFDLAAAHVPGYLKHADFGQSEAFYDFNTGVIALRRTPAVAEFVANWRELHERWSKVQPFPMTALDQAAFRCALWKSSLSPYVLGSEYNYRTIFSGRLVGAAKIIHGRSKDYEKLAAHINTRVGPRIFDAFPPGREW